MRQNSILRRGSSGLLERALDQPRSLGRTARKFWGEIRPAVVEGHHRPEHSLIGRDFTDRRREPSSASGVPQFGDGNCPGVSFSPHEGAAAGAKRGAFIFFD
jgi:hypothetical protein